MPTKQKTSPPPPRVREQGPVPHHQVDAKIHAKARRKADRMGVSLSEVARAGLEQYVAEVPTRTRNRYLALDGTDIESIRQKQELPRETFRTIAAMKAARDPLLNRFILAMYEAGWSLSALCEPLGVTRQAVHIRIRQEQTRQAEGRKPRGRLPEIPEPPFLMPGPGSAPDRERTDWAVWVDRDTYVVASQHARRQGEPMHQVMEGILRSFLADEIPLGE